MILPMRMMARGNSERVPDKNGSMFCGRPLIEWTFLCGQKAKYVGDMYLVTDSSYYAELAERNGVTPIMQPEASCNFGKWGGPVADALVYSYLIKNNLPHNWITYGGANAPLKRPIDMDGMISYVDKNLKHKTNLVEVINLSCMGSTGLYRDGGNFQVKGMQHTNLNKDMRLMQHSGAMGANNWDVYWKAYDYRELIFDDMEAGVIKPAVLAGDPSWCAELDEKGIKNFHPEVLATKEEFFYLLPRYAGIDIDDIYDWNYCEWAFEKYILNEGYYD